MKKERLYYGWIVLAACLAFGLIIYGTRYSFGVFFNSLEADFGWTRTMTSGVFSVNLLLGGLFAVLGGWALDRYGPRTIVILMGSFTGLSLLLTAQANSLWHIFITYSLLLAIGTGPIYVLTMVTGLKWFAKRRGLALAIAGSGSGAGIMVMSPIAAYLISGYGWQNAYLIMGLVVLFTIIPIALLFKKTPPTAIGLPNGEKPAITNPDSPKGQLQSEPVDFSLPQAARSKNFWLLFFIWLILSLCVHLILAHLVPHAIDLGIAPMKAATILTLLGGAAIPGRLFMGRISDSLGRKAVATASALLMAGAMLLLIAATDLWILYVAAMMLGIGWGGQDAPVAALVGEVFGLRNIGVIMGILLIGWSIGAAAGPALAGYLFDINGNYVYAFLAGAIAMFIAAALLFSITRPGVKQ